MKIYYAVLCLLIIVCCAVFVLKKPDIKYDILWTCTAFFDHSQRWEQFQEAMDSIVRLHPPHVLEKIQKWIVLNEYYSHPKHDYAALIREKYPWITFVQKPAGHEGISNSVNMIMDSYVPHSRLWIHWEETWVARMPFIERAISCMNLQPHITQLTFIYKNGRTEWSDIGRNRLKCSGDICLVGPHPDYKWYDAWDGSVEGMTDEVQAKWSSTWPLYQLLPSINRSAFYNRLPRFHRKIKHAEWLFAREWLRAGGIKAIFHEAPVWRPSELSHVSTHD